MAASQVSSPTPSALDGFFPSPVLDGRRAAGNLDSWERLVSLFNAAERCVDTVAVIAAVYCALALHRLLGLGSEVQYPVSTMLLYAAAFALLFVILLERRGGYRPYVSLLAVGETEQVLRVTMESFLLVLLVAYFTTEHISRLVAVLVLVTVPTFVIVGKWEMRNGLRLLRAGGYGSRRAVIVGVGPSGRRIYSALVRSPKCGIEPVAFVDDDPQKQGLEIYESAYERKRSTKVLPGPVCPKLLQELDARVMFITTPGPEREVVTAIASAAGMDTYFVPEDSSKPGYRIDYVDFDGITLAHVSKGQTRAVGDFAKRAIDVVVSVVCLA
ncbi:MAG: nucleoside-diphosphate sugar epimerase/dehydratase, partial [Candidatus Korobacteraceae bacterium]